MKNVRIWMPFVGLAMMLSVNGSAAAATPVCSDTARIEFEACRTAAQEDYLIAAGRCMNEPDDGAQCLTEALAERGSTQRLCRRQRASRFEICARLGEAAYDPSIEPELFDADLAHPTKPNPYFPLRVGAHWEWGGAESVTIEVLDRFKRIEDVPCFVVRDTVSVDGVVAEDTEDWFAQAKSGDVYYFGEQVSEFESFAEDAPPTPELTSIDGSFKTGRDGAKPGIAFPFAPHARQFYRQEFSLGDAEDVADVLTTSYVYGQNAELDRLVPRALADLLCGAGDHCVVTKEFQPQAPGVFERKYYAPGVGGFLVVHLSTDEVVQLIGCNVDPRCAQLPAP